MTWTKTIKDEHRETSMDIDEHSLEEKATGKLTVSQIDLRMKRGCWLLVGKLFVPVKVLNHKWELGHNRFLITPLTGGRGEMWKNEEKLKFG